LPEVLGDTVTESICQKVAGIIERYERYTLVV
jgi:hypothetical protein